MGPEVKWDRVSLNLFGVDYTFCGLRSCSVYLRNLFDTYCEFIDDTASV